MDDESACNHGAGAGQCMDLPPTRAHDVWRVDAVRAPAEYWGSVTLPLANVSAQATGGQIYVSVTEPATTSSTRRVHVYVDDMPVSVNSSEVAVYVDAHRFDTAAAGVGRDDVRYVVDLASGAARAERVSWGASGSFRWVAVDARGLEASLGVCRTGQGSADDVRVCDLELAFNLPRGHSRPAAGDVEGIGFAFSDDLRSVVMPEDLAEPPRDDLDPRVDRRRYMTLLFRRPDGVPFSVMSWNMAHWGRDFEWDPRLDYILVRPPALASEGLVEPPGYLMARGRAADGSDLPPSELLWPAVNQDASAHLCLAAGYDPSSGEVAGLRRLSDHAPIVANLELGILREPARYHPGWPHDLIVRVNTYNATGKTDCWRDICGPLDPYIFWWGHRVDLTGLSRNFVPLDNMESHRCSGWTGSWPAKRCMDNWVLTDHVEPGVYREHRVSPLFYDDDGLHGVDDFYATLEEGGPPVVKINWANRNIVVSRETERAVPPASFLGAEQLQSTDPWRWCTRTDGQPVSVCLRVSTLEARP